MYVLITNSDINILNALNATLPALSHARLTVYSTGDEQGWQKFYNLSQRFGLFHYGKKYPNAWYLVLTSYLWLEFIFIFDVTQLNVFVCF